ncbi:MAG: pentapeptide repeat-containing protein [Actinomycetota bacterium]
MSTPLASGCYRAHQANLAGSEFLDVNLSGARFNDVNLRGAEFINVALTNAVIRDVCLSDVTIQEASYEGMRIEGILVTELLRVYREHAASDEASEA